MRIFVTGGGGFVGSHLVDFLIKENHTVTIFDDMFSRSADTNPQAETINGDIRDYGKLEESIKEHDCVIHLAAKISVPESISNPQVTNAVNVDGTLNVLTACSKQNISKFIFASSAAVYGESKDIPISENTQVNPVSPYGASKAAAESYIKAFSNCFEIESVILRIFNVYGKGQSDEYAGVITKFTKQIRNNKNLTIFGDGTQTRDFVSINDVVDAFSQALKNIEKKRGTIYNIASGNYVSINDLADTMIEISGKDLKVEHTKPRLGDIKDSQCSIFLAKKDLGFVPQTNLRDGLTKLLEQP